MNTAYHIAVTTGETISHQILWTDSANPEEDLKLFEELLPETSTKIIEEWKSPFKALTWESSSGFSKNTVADDTVPEA